MRRIAITLISLYQKTLSPDHGPLKRFFSDGCCVYEQTCSEYGKEMIQKYGVARGSAKTLRRILSCH